MLRKHEIFGDCLVLLLESETLQTFHDKHHEDPGLKWGFPSYKPHVTVAKSESDQNFDRIIPWTGEIILGPEVSSLCKSDGKEIPNSLYISRRVINSKSIKAWYEGMGIKSVEPEKALHVTVVWSKTAPTRKPKLDPQSLTIIY